jgi:hypothetical protein
MPDKPATRPSSYWVALGRQAALAGVAVRDFAVPGGNTDGRRALDIMIRTSLGLSPILTSHATGRLDTWRRDGSDLQILRLASFVTRPVWFQSETRMF